MAAPPSARSLVTPASLRVMERVAVALLLLAAFVPRVRDFRGTFDREFEGFQGTFFASCALNYERLGLGHLGGYPSLNIDLPEGDYKDGAYIYGNHPPTVPLLTWASLKLLAPEGWGEAWREFEPPEGIEPYVRFPFLALHMLGLFAFWWALRQASGPRVALLGLAVLAMTPVSVLYAQLVNYENPSLPFICLGCGFHARYLRGMSGPNLLGMGLSFAAAAAVTFAPLFFVPPLVLQALLRRGWRGALRPALAVGLCAALPIAVHGLWVRAALPSEASESVLARAAHLIEPMFTGAEPFGEWVRRQAVRASFFLSPPIVAAALGGLGVIAWRRLRGAKAPNAAADGRVELAPPLLLGGVTLQLLFYTHTFDGEGVWDGQTVFLLNLAPGAAAAAAVLLDALATPLARLRGGVAPLVVATSLVGLPGIARANQVRYRWREPGPRDDPARTFGPDAPLPATVGREISELLPPVSVGFYPEALGFNQAASWYAWRTLIDVEKETFGAGVGIATLLGLGERPRFLLIPKDPAPEVEAQVGDVHEQLKAAGEPFRTSEHWEVWSLDG
ncbi:MAG: glycosyltransferase family 39 protein [Planctomycetota bacterium]